MKKIPLYLFLLFFMTVSISRAQCLMGDCKNGKGVMLFPNGIKYTGEFKNGYSHGQGKVVYPDERTYEGEFRNGVPDGKGKAVKPNGVEYEGDFKKGYPHGYGVQTFTTGDVYVGEFKEGIKEGTGTMTFSDGKKYQGQFRNDKANGFGVLTLKDGTQKRVFVKDWRYQTEPKFDYNKIDEIYEESKQNIEGGGQPAEDFFMHDHGDSGNREETVETPAESSEAEGKAGEEKKSSP